MKKLLATLAAALVGFVATPNTAEAGVHISIGSGYTYVSGRASCGCPIYTKRVVRGYDGYRRPIYNYYRQPFRCGCRTTYRPPVRHHSSRHYVSPRYTNSRGRDYRNHGNRGRYVTPSRARSSRH